MAKNGKRFEPIQALFNRFEDEPSHAIQVKRLSLQLFDCLTKLHGLGDHERQLLDAAAMLHDIGWSQGQKAHHKSSMKLILKNRFDGWTSEEQLIIANVARYHRKAGPKENHKKFAALSLQDRQIVNQLAALLRIADGLDRSHGDVVETVKCDIKNDQVLLTLICRRDMQLEHYGFDKKRDLFQKVYGIDIVIHDIKNSWDH